MFLVEALKRSYFERANYWNKSFRGFIFRLNDLEILYDISFLVFLFMIFDASCVGVNPTQLILRINAPLSVAS